MAKPHYDAAASFTHSVSFADHFSNGTVMQLYNVTDMLNYDSTFIIKIRNVVWVYCIVVQALTAALLAS